MVDPTKKLFHCEKNCGYEGTFGDVEAHEKTCTRSHANAWVKEKGTDTQARLQEQQQCHPMDFVPNTPWKLFPWMVLAIIVLLVVALKCCFPQAVIWLIVGGLFLVLMAAWGCWKQPLCLMEGGCFAGPPSAPEVPGDVSDPSHWDQPEKAVVVHVAIPSDQLVPVPQGRPPQFEVILTGFPEEAGSNFLRGTAVALLEDMDGYTVRVQASGDLNVLRKVQRQNLSQMKAKVATVKANAVAPA